MSTLWDLISDPISLIVFAMYGSLILWEAMAPARPLPPVRAWRLRGLGMFTFTFLLSSFLPLLWTDAFAHVRLFDLTGLDKWTGAFVGFVVYEAGVYFWHRTMHGSRTLWLGLHQMHHSAERLDTFSAFWTGPLDTVGWTTLSTLCLTSIVGVSGEAAVLVLYATTFLSIFQHANLRTPRWLGYFIQRPEAHSYHHGRGVHAKNYSDLPIFDILFGTFHNPRHFAPATGFYDGASSRFVEMLRFRDVSAPRLDTAN